MAGRAERVRHQPLHLAQRGGHRFLPGRPVGRPLLQPLWRPHRLDHAVRHRRHRWCVRRRRAQPLRFRQFPGQRRPGRGLGADLPQRPAARPEVPHRGALSVRHLQQGHERRTCEHGSGAADRHKTVVVKTVEVPSPPVIKTVEVPTPPKIIRCPAPFPGAKLDENGCAIAPQKVVLHGVHFEFNKATLLVDSKALLNQVGEAMKSQKGMTVRIDGHTDDIGSDAYNMKLSQQRADSVRAYLITRGIDGSRMSTQGFGKRKPIVTPQNTAAARELNRRVEFDILTP
ncbi:MAG: OmpA family protein [Nevskiaceae bacterium]|nr:MAG: OmpA family protein [Nevskiaceae bacterium]TBR72756.1 MAG: OmpA family protein [Nevskiaceae bacterium]